MAIQLKAHGAWLGGGTGAGLAGLIVGLLQQHLVHHPLAPIDVEAIYSGVGVLGAFGGAWLLPAPLAAVLGALGATPAPAPAPAPAPVPTEAVQQGKDGELTP